LTPIVRYALACAGVVGAAVLVAAVTLDGPGLAGVLAAAAVALPVQIGAFAALTWVRVGTNAFLAAWVGGTAVRMAVVGLAGWALVASPRFPPLPTLLGLAGFFSVMLLMEPHFLGLGATRSRTELRRE
jgi:hypothetical protein